MFVCFCFVEESKKSLCPSLVNDRILWDGGTVTNTYSQSETVLHDQRGKTMGDAKESIEEPEPGDSNTKPDMDKEPLTAEPHNETVKDAPPKMSEMQSELKGGGEASEHKGMHIAIHHKDTEDDISPQQTLIAQFKCLQTEDSMQEINCPLQKQTKTLEVSALKAEENERTCLTDEQIQTSNLDESQPPAKTTSEVTECWDEYIVPTVADAAGKSEIIFASFLPNTQADSELGHAQPSWHFPAGPGLSQEVQCPLWQHPAGSYYPPLGPTVPFEGK